MNEEPSALPTDRFDHEPERLGAEHDPTARRIEGLVLHGLPILTPEELDESEGRAEEDMAAGRVVPHEEVADWLRTWGKPDAKPMPREWSR